MATAITTASLTTKSLTGTGVFDELMAAANVHLQNEYSAQRITGPEYSQVYLGAMQAVLQQSIGFLLAKEKAEKETALVEAQTIQTTAETTRTAQDTLNLVSQELKIDAESLVLAQDKLNGVIQGTVLEAQRCKLAQEFNVLVAQVNKIVAEITLVTQKKTTEEAQTLGTVVQSGSVLDKQNGLYDAQTAGFARDAEQKAAKIMVDTWNVRRTTDTNTVPHVDTNLEDTDIGLVVAKLKTGIGVV